MTRDFYVLCEGYHDRDFLAGWLESASGWTDPSRGGTRPIAGFANEDVPKGGFVFASGETRVCLVPTGGRSALQRQLGRWLEEISDLYKLSYEGIVVVADPDGPCSSQTDAVEDLVRQELLKAGSAAAGPAPWNHQGVVVDYASMRTGPVAEASDLPDTENLERVVATAFARAYPTRHRAVMRGLDLTLSKSWRFMRRAS
jgi:hypothetical protein